MTADDHVPRTSLTLAALVAASRRTRLDALKQLPASDELRFALRRVLFTDDHAEVRAHAARRLGQFADVEPWLLDAIEDSSPMVRDSVLRALARAGTMACAPRLRALVEGDPMWWIRRSAIYALAAIAGEAELATFTRALADPFWRVRHAAVRVLAALGAAHPEIRDEVIDAPEPGHPGTLAFLRASWGPVALEAPARAALPSALPAELLDPDPAVVTARLASGVYPPLVLVELLCDPHVPLRMLAMQRIARSRDRAALEAALDWLEEPRIPHVGDTVHRLLDGLGELARDLATVALARTDRPGAAQWAITWIAATRSESLYEPALERARRADDTELRRAALAIATERDLLVWADDDFLVDAIAVELHGRHRAAAQDVLLALDGSDHPRLRALQLDARARRAEWSAVAAGLDDPHHAPRAVATRWLARASNDARAVVARRLDELAADPDPAVREAALTVEHAALAIRDDRDPWVRRAAIATLAHGFEHASAEPADPDAVVAALGDPDPWVRARACAVPCLDDRAITRVLELAGARNAMVRASAHEALGRLPDGDARLRALMPALAPHARLMAHAWLSRALDDAAVGAARAAIEAEDDPRVRAALAAIGGVAIEAPVDLRVDTETDDADDDTHLDVEVPASAAPTAPRRPFGRAGFDVAPLAISGAYDLHPGALAAADAAGVDLYFWEPGYDVLGKFLRAPARRDRTRVITGTYHADAASIRADVDRALRQLRRDTLDAFLLFWTRSPARIDAEAYGVLDELRRAGKIRAVGFSTHHRELARSAIETTPWDVVMIRHSAAHPGIESALLPTARARGTAIVTFSALCYGRMLSGPGAPSAAECYRYALAQDGVTACISAPRRFRELVANLGVLTAPALAAERIAELRAHGSAVHAESARFNALVRQPTRDAAAAARELLAAELPPADAEAVPRRMPVAAATKRSRTRLGSIRRR